MNQIRAQLTRLKSKVVERLPDGNDVFGFAGVTKEGVLEYIDRAHHLTERIEALRGQFPIVALKRKIRPHVDVCKDYLNESQDEQAKDKHFDEFLKSLTYIHDEIALTHTVFLSETLRTDVELEAIRTKTKELQDEYFEIEPQVADLTEKLEKIGAFYDDIESKSDEVDELKLSAETAQKAILDAASNATVKAEVITKYEAETKTQKQEVVSLATRLTGLEKKLKALLIDSQDHVRQSEENLKKVSELEQTNSHQQQVIQQTLKMASKYGMAASFKERKDELHWPMWAWAGLFTLSIIGLFVTGSVYVIPQLENPENATLTGVLVKISLVTPWVWLGWMAAKQYGYISRIREDYSFKYASALAFEGYKKEALDVNREMLGGLLSVATENMSLNPLRIYGSEENNHASPVHEALSSVFKRDAKTASNSNSTETPST